jgi:enoyl-CoA hydratase/carnithine racemase
MNSGTTASPLRFEVEDRIAVLTLDRPDRGNSINPQMMMDLEHAWTRIQTDLEIRVAVITGAGERHFCTGADVSDLKQGVGGLNNRQYHEENRFTARMMHVTKPVVCAVNGLVNGGGLHFVADSDIVVSRDDVEFMDTHVSVGQVSALESVGVARRAGLGAALLMGLAGRGYRMPARRAYELGLVDLLEPTADAARARAMELARAIAQNSPQAMSLTKRAIWGVVENSEPQATHYAWEMLKSHWTHPDFDEGPKAFNEKRPANWNPDPNARR